MGSPFKFFLFVCYAAKTSDDECSDYSAMVQIPKMTELEWVLSLREEENEIVRSEFYYEQVMPSRWETNFISGVRLMRKRGDGCTGKDKGGKNPKNCFLVMCLRGNARCDGSKRKEGDTSQKCKNAAENCS